MFWAILAELGYPQAETIKLLDKKRADCDWKFFNHPMTPS